MDKKIIKPKEIWAVSPTLGKTRFPVVSADTYVEWENGTPKAGKTKMPKFTTGCTRCKACEVICAMSREKASSPGLSRIRIVTNEIEWIEGKTDTIVETKICRQCPGVPACILACPKEGAIYRNPETGVVLVNFDLCIRCKQCVKACPYDAIWYNKEVDKILKCDTCNGKPKCVSWCPVECIKLEKIA